MKPSILFMGTPELARVCLVSLVDAGYPIVGVVSQPDKPAGRGQIVSSPPCALYAKEKKLPLFQPKEINPSTSLRAGANDSFLKKMKELAPDLIVVVAYGKFLPSQLLSLPKIETINMHASLLPKYRGAAPINWAIINGENETGVSVMKVSEKMDAGPVYSQKKVIIEQEETAGSLNQKLALAGAELLLETIPKIEKGLKPLPQNAKEVTLAPRLKKEAGKINWNEPAETIDKKIRGLNPWPGAYTSIDNKTLKIYHASLLNEKTDSSPGTVYFLNEQGIQVVCGKGALCLTEVQIEGKKKMPASEFVRGYRLGIGTKLT